MAVPSDEHERTLAFAEIAFQQIRALRLPASPRNFEIWYQYGTGHSPGLNRAINDTLAEKARCRKPTSSGSTKLICRPTAPRIGSITSVRA